jgi:hypothetical protein
MRGLDTPETGRGWRNLLRIICASSWIIFTQLYLDAGQQNIKKIMPLLLCFPYSIFFREILFFSTLFSKFSYSVFFCIRGPSENRSRLWTLSRNMHITTFIQTFAFNLLFLHWKLNLFQASHNKQATKKFVSISLAFVRQHLIGSSWIY